MSSAVAPHHRKRRRNGAPDSPYSSTRCRRSNLLVPSYFPAVRPFVLRFALATTPYPRRKRRIHDAHQPTSTPRRRRRIRSSIVPLHLPALRPFAFRYFLAAGASAPRRRRRKSALVDMGNYVSRLFGKGTSDDGLGVYREWVEGSREAEDPTVATKVEEKVNVVRKGIIEVGIKALEASAPPQTREPCYKRMLERTKTHDGRFEEAGFEVKLPQGELENLWKASADRPQEDLSELFTPLTYEEESEVNNILNGGGHSKKTIAMHEPSNIEITREKFWCLRTHGWLNDEVINLYVELLKERAEREPKRFLKCHFFNTFFLKKLACGKIGYDYQSVRRWTTLNKLGYGLVECEKIFVPVHRDIHWCLVIINMKDRTFQYLDSLGGMDRAVLRILARYIMDELKDKSNIEIDTSSWLEVSDSLPLQQNGWDCGMFMLKFIDFHSRGLGLSFSQEHVEYFRKRTAKEILRLRAD